LTLAWVNPTFIPIELLLLNDSTSVKIEQIMHLCQWGLIHKQTTSGSTSSLSSRKCANTWRVQDYYWDRFWSLIGRRFYRHLIQPLVSVVCKVSNVQLGMSHLWYRLSFSRNNHNNSNNDDNTREPIVYVMSPKTQLELCQLLQWHLELDDSDQHVGGFVMRTQRLPNSRDNARVHCCTVFVRCAVAGVTAFNRFQVLRAIRIWNRGMTLGILATGKLLPWVGAWSVPSQSPQKHDRYQEYWRATTWLNVLMLYLCFKVLIQLFWVALYLLQAYMAIVIVGSYFVAPPTERWKRTLRTIVVSSWVVYQLCRTYWCFQSWAPLVLAIGDGMKENGMSKFYFARFLSFSGWTNSCGQDDTSITVSEL